MKVGIAVILLLVVEISAKALEPKESYQIVGKIHHRNAAELKAYHQKRQASQKNFIPGYPEEPLVTGIKIGGSQQEFKVVVEISSHKLWVLDSTYTPTPHAATFNPNDPKSTATKKGPFETSSEEFEVYGQVYEDVVHLFCNNITQSFGVVNQSSYNVEFDSDYSGVLGLGWNPNADFGVVTPDSSPLMNIFPILPGAPLLARRYLQLLSREGNVTTGVITFGGQDLPECKLDSIASAPLSFDYNIDALTFKLDSFSLGDQTTGSNKAKLDSGSPVVELPQDAFDIVYKTLKPVYDYHVGVYTTDCRNKDVFNDFVFTVNGVKLPVSASTYIVDLGLGDGKCVVAFWGSPNSIYGLGVPFQYTYCVEMDVDNNMVSFRDLETY